MPASGPDAITADIIKRSIHDLKGPANRVRALAQLLGRNLDAADEDSHKLLGFIEDSAAAVAAVADGLKRYIETCTRPIRREPLDLSLALQSAISNLAPELRQRGGHVTHAFLPVVEADGFLISWVFQELLANALHAGAARIHVAGGHLHSGEEFISISDDGPGIDSHMTERIFRPFEKMTSGEGAGLGLTICQKIIELHNGRIWAEDRTGGGEIRFTIGVS